MSGYIPQKPVSGLSSQFNANNISNSYTVQEHAVYAQKREEIQKFVVRNFAACTWEIDASNVSHEVRNRLKDRITKRGFNCLIESPDSYQSGMSEWDYSQVNKRTIKITLPSEALEEKDEGYFSDGWDTQFRAAKVSQKYNEYCSKQYLDLAQFIERIIASHPGYRVYHFDVTMKSYEKVVLSWLEQDLKDRGFKIEQESGTVPSDISGATDGYYRYFICTNPQITNFLTLNLYL